MSRHQQDWDEYIPYLLFAYNTSVHPATNHTPFYITYGRDPILPIDIALRTNSQRPRYNINQYAVMLATRLTEAANLVYSNVRKIQAKTKQRWDEHVRPRSFQPGDRVWAFMPDLRDLDAEQKRGATQIIRRSRKLALRWRGPFRIIERRGQSLYKLDKPTGKIKGYVTNIKLLKPCIDWVNPNLDVTDNLQQLIDTWHEHNRPIRARVLQ